MLPGVGKTKTRILHCIFSFAVFFSLCYLGKSDNKSSCGSLPRGKQSAPASDDSSFPPRRSSSASRRPRARPRSRARAGRARSAETRGERARGNVCVTIRRGGAKKREAAAERRLRSTIWAWKDAAFRAGNRRLAGISGNNPAGPQTNPQQTAPRRLRGAAGGRPQPEPERTEPLAAARRDWRRDWRGADAKQQRNVDVNVMSHVDDDILLPLRAKNLSR